jgi:hypothetical protein
VTNWVTIASNAGEQPAGAGVEKLSILSVTHLAANEARSL